MLVFRMAAAAVFVASSVWWASPARAMPSIPTCPGNGNDTVVIGADGGWCDFLFMPDGSHVACRWADWSFLIGDIAGHSECRRVDTNEQLLPGSPPWETFEHWGDNERAPAPHPRRLTLNR